VPIRWRLAGGSALLTLVILCGFAGAVGGLTSMRLHQDFEREVNRAAGVLAGGLDYQNPEQDARTRRIQLAGLSPGLDEVAPGTGAIIRIVTRAGIELNATRQTKDFGRPRVGSREIDGYRVETRLLDTRVEDLPLFGRFYVQYARPLQPLEETVDGLRLFLIIGVLSGAGLALLAGLMVARRAMMPIALLTATARRSSARATPHSASPRSRPTTRSPSSRARSATCSTRSTPRARRPRARWHASASSSPTLRTSCARR